MKTRKRLKSKDIYNVTEKQFYFKAYHISRKKEAMEEAAQQKDRPDLHLARATRKRTPFVGQVCAMAAQFTKATIFHIEYMK